MAEEGTSEQNADTGVSPDEVADLLSKDLEAIREKVRNKKPLSDAEIKRLQAHQRQSDKTSDPMEPVWAKNQAELAASLNCSRKSIGRFLKIEGEEAPPAATTDGRYNVTMWKVWAHEHGHLTKKLSTAADRQMLEDKLLQEQIEKAQIENALKRGELMSVDEVCRVLTDMAGGIVDGLRSSKHALAPRVVGQTVPEATKLISIEHDAQLSKLSLGEWAKKKIFWSKISAHLSDLRRRYNLGVGPSATS